MQNLREIDSRDTRLLQVSHYLFVSFPLLIRTDLRSIAIILSLIIHFYLGIKYFGRESSKKMIWVLLLQITPFILYPISLLYSENLDYGLKFIPRVLTLYLVPVAFYMNRDLLKSIGVSKTQKWYLYVISFLILYAISSMLFMNTFSRSFHAHDIHYVLRTDLEGIVNIHPTYLSILVSIALLILQNNFKSKKYTRKNIIQIVQGIIFLTGLIIASSKMIIVATFISSMILWFSKENWQRMSMKFGIILILLIVMVFTIKPVKERFIYLVKAISESTINYNNPDSMRKAIFFSSKEVIEEHLIIGTGIGDEQDELNKKYSKYNNTLALSMSFNTHNQYLQILLSTGVFSFILFIALMFVQLFLSIKGKNALYTSITILFMLSFLTENILVRQVGVFSYTFFSCLLLYHTKKEDLI